MPTVCFFLIIWTHRQEVGWSDLQSFISLSPSSLPCFHCLSLSLSVFLLLALGTHRQLPSTPLSCTQEFMHKNTHTHTHTHTHSHTHLTHISPSPHTVPSCCYCNRAHSSPFYLGCNCHSCRERDRERQRERERRLCSRVCSRPLCHHKLIERWSHARVASLSVLDVWLAWVERYSHGGHVLQGLVKSRGQEGLVSAGGPAGRWSRRRFLIFLLLPWGNFTLCGPHSFCVLITVLLPALRKHVTSVSFPVQRSVAWTVNTQLSSINTQPSWVLVLKL